MLRNFLGLGSRLPRHASVVLSAATVRRFAVSCSGSMGKVLPACNGFRFWKYSDKFLLEPLDGKTKPLTVDRSTGSLSAGGDPSLEGVEGEPRSMCGLLGFIDLLAGTYVLAISNRSLVGSFAGGHVFKVEAVDIVPCNPSTANLTAQEKADEQEYIVRLKSAVAEHGLYFSYTSDITTNLQAQQEKTDTTPLPLWKQVSDKFFWNQYLSQRAFNVPEASPFILPVMQGNILSPHDAALLNRWMLEQSIVALLFSLHCIALSFCRGWIWFSCIFSHIASEALSVFLWISEVLPVFHAISEALTVFLSICRALPDLPPIREALLVLPLFAASSLQTSPSELILSIPSRIGSIGALRLPGRQCLCTCPCAPHLVPPHTHLRHSIALTQVAACECYDVCLSRFGSIYAPVNGTPIEVTLIARRYTARIGTRMWRRGADSKGGVSNLVETEQVLTVDGGLVASHLQIRGSIPVTWEQVVNLKYKPKMKVVNTDQPLEAPLQQHLRLLKESYGKVVAADLVNQKGGELGIGSAYAGAVEALKDNSLRYVPFDFNQVCGHTHFDRLSILMDKIKADIAAHGYFERTEGGEVVRTQAGIVRTNCVDCLDRTNVTQSTLARAVLEQQLRDAKLLPSTETVESHTDLDSQMKILWANHGDDISTEYSGTGALKRDFVRTGKRSIGGLLEDGVNAIMRYVLNNFADGVRQDGLDLVMGNYQVNPSKPSPFVREGLEKFTLFRPAFSVLSISSLLTIWLLSSVSKSASPAPAIFFASIFMAINGAILFAFNKYGRLFCDRPRFSSSP